MTSSTEVLSTGINFQQGKKKAFVFYERSCGYWRVKTNCPYISPICLVQCTDNSLRPYLKYGDGWKEFLEDVFQTMTALVDPFKRGKHIEDDIREMENRRWFHR